jgi:hypothetical protein
MIEIRKPRFSSAQPQGRLRPDWFQVLALVADLGRRRVFGLHFSAVLNSSRRHIRVSEPCLDFGEVDVVIERVGLRR